MQSLILLHRAAKEAVAQSAGAWGAYILRNFGGVRRA